MRFVAGMRELALDALALLWPTACVGCGQADRELCLRCTDEVAELPHGLPHGVGPMARSVDGPIHVIAGPYSGTVREMLIAYKHGGKYGFVKILGRRLGVALRQACKEIIASGTGAGEQPPVIVPVPSRAQRVRQRGFRHVDALVSVGLRSEGLRIRQIGGLRALPGRTGQVGLSEAARERNARKLYVPKRAATQLRGRTVIVVDDIVTSGATTRAACEQLERAGARVVAVVALCAVTRKDALR